MFIIKLRYSVFEMVRDISLFLYKLKDTSLSEASKVRSNSKRKTLVHFHQICINKLFKNHKKTIVFTAARPRRTRRCRSVRSRHTFYCFSAHRALITPARTHRRLILLYPPYIQYIVQDVHNIYIPRATNVDM